MAKRSLLLVDGDTKSLRVLEVSLKKAGFNVTTATTGKEALETAENSLPDLIIAETEIPDMDGYEFCRRFKEHPSWDEIPFVFLTAQTAIENKIKGLELGVDDYLTKPIYIKEILTRVRILLQKRDRANFEQKKDNNTRFAGHLGDMGVVDLIQTIEVSRKTGVIHFRAGERRQATIFFKKGRVIDAEAGHLQGEDAVYRLLTWSDGEFEALFRPVRRKPTIEMSSQGLLMEGMRRLDEWGRLQEQLPPLSQRFEVVYDELWERLAELPDDLNKILRLFDSRRTLAEVIDGSTIGDLEAVEIISKLYFEGIIVEAGSQDNLADTMEIAGMLNAQKRRGVVKPTKKTAPMASVTPPPGDTPSPAQEPALESVEAKQKSDSEIEDASEEVLTEGNDQNLSESQEAEESFASVSSEDPLNLDQAAEAALLASESADSHSRAKEDPASTPSIPVATEENGKVEDGKVENEASELGSLSEEEPVAEAVRDTASEGSADARGTAPDAVISTVKAVPDLLDQAISDATPLLSSTPERVEETPLEPNEAEGREAANLDFREAEVTVEEPNPNHSKAEGRGLRLEEMDVSELDKEGSFEEDKNAHFPTDKIQEDNIAPPKGVALAAIQLARRAVTKEELLANNLLKKGARSTEEEARGEPPTPPAPSEDVEEEIILEETPKDASPISVEGAVEAIVKNPRSQRASFARFDSEPGKPVETATDWSTPEEVEGLISSEGSVNHAVSGAVAADDTNKDRPIEIPREESEPLKAISSISRHDEDDEEEPSPSNWPIVVIALAMAAGLVFFLTRSASKDSSAPPPQNSNVAAVADAASRPAPSDAAPEPGALVDAGAGFNSGGMDAGTGLVGLPDAGPLPPDAGQVLLPPDAAPSSTQPETLSREEKSKQLLAQARRSQRRGDRIDALSMIDESLELRKSSSALLFKAELLLDVGDKAAALRIAEELVRVAPRRASGWRIKGKVELAQGNTQAGKASLRRYLELAPSARDSAAIRAKIGD